MKFPIKAALVAILVFAVPTATSAQTEPNYVQSYRAGDIDAALDQAKAATRRNSDDGKAWYYLGLARAKIDDLKGAQKALMNAQKLLPSNAEVLSSLAWISLMRGERVKAADYAKRALERDDRNAEAYYFLAITALEERSYIKANEQAASAIEVDPKMWAAYRIRALATIGSLAPQSPDDVKSPTVHADLLQNAAQDFEVYLNETPKTDPRPGDAAYLTRLRYFANHYRNLDRAKAAGQDTSDATRVPHRILSKPKAVYTDQARISGVEGWMRVLAELRADGKIGHLLILNPLGSGLDENVLEAANQISFEPAKENGVAVTTVVHFEYGFILY